MNIFFIKIFIDGILMKNLGYKDNKVNAKDLLACFSWGES